MFRNGNLSPVGTGSTHASRFRAPGIAPDMKLTLHLYVCTMEAEDAAQTFAGARDFLNHYIFNLMGILDQCSLEAVEPVAARLDDACYVHNQTSDWPAEFKLAAAWGRGRFAYLQGRAEDARASAA